MTDPRDSEQPTDRPSPPSPSLVVGIGASAGGIEALRKFFGGFEDWADLTFVVVQHVDPASQKLLLKTIAQAAAIPAIPIEDGTSLEPGRVYVAPARRAVRLVEGSFRLGKPQDVREGVIDVFFRSLAQELNHRAVGVILSGTGGDGSAGLKVISGADGLTLTQDLESAEYEGMPRAAFETGGVDQVLPPEKMAAELLKYRRHLEWLHGSSQEAQLREQLKHALPAIVEVLEDRTSQDFRHYRENTLVRRVLRRLQVLRLTSVDDYLARLRESEAESEALFKDLLIGVTTFFRDPEAWEVVERQALPKLLAGRGPEQQVRVWVIGCATGEEAYSAAILLREQLDRLEKPPRVQVLATDIDAEALGLARKGVYSSGAVAGVSPVRLSRFFIQKGSRYHVSPEIREMCLFSLHNLVSDPPFARQDLICCRNLLIYLDQALQQKLIPLFHYALRQGGYLFLGPSENLTSHRDLFEPVSAKHRISRRKEAAAQASLAQLRPAAARGFLPQQGPVSALDLEQLMQRIVLDEFAPKSAIVDEDGRILSASAGIGQYLEIGAGPYQNNVVKLARSGLRVGLRAALAEARKTRRRIDNDRLAIRSAGNVQRVKLTVQPMPQLGHKSDLALVVFQDLGRSINRQRAIEELATSEADSLIEHLERELVSTRWDLEKSVQDLEAANEELKSSNEELLSMNEELQSANEELESSKEEIQAGSEALARAKSDIENLLSSTRIATIFLNDKLEIRNFTSSADAIYNLISSDLGRPLWHVTDNAIEMPPLPNPAQLRERSEAVENEVVTRDGRRYLRRALPYETHEGRREGMVLTFIDVTDLRRSEREAQERLAEIEGIYASAPAGLAVVDRNLRFVRVNRFLAEANGLPPEQHLGKTVEEVTGPLGEAVVPRMRRVLESGEPEIDFEIRGELRDGSGERDRIASYYPLRSADGEVIGLNIVIRDITERKRIERERERLARILDATPDLVVVVDSRLEEVGYINEGGRRLLGYDDAQQALDLDVRSLFHREAWEALESEALPAAVEEGYWSGESVLVTRRGRQIPVTLVVLAHKGADGGVTDYSISARDIRDQKRVEAELIDHRERLRAAIEAAADIGTWRVDLYTGWETRDAGLNRILGLPAAETTQPVEEFFELVYPDDRKRVKEAWERGVLSEGSYEIEHRIVRADGDVRWVRDRGRVLYDANGKSEYATGAVVDITERKRWEQTLEASELRFRTMADSAPVLIWMAGTDKKFTFVNRVWLEFTGRTLDKEVGEGWTASVHPEDWERCVGVFHESFARREGFESEYRLRRHDGQYRWILNRGVPLYAGGDELTGFIGSGIDVTERRAIEQAYRLAQERLHLALSAARIGTGIFDLGAGRLIVHERLSKLLSCTPEQVREGLRIEEFLELVHEDDRSYVERRLREAGEPGETYDIQFHLIEPDGSLSWFVWRGRWERDEHGAARLPGAMVDITELKQTQEAYRLAQERLHLALSAARIGTGIFDLGAGRLIVHERLSKLLSCTPEQVREGLRIEEFLELVHEGDRPYVERRLREAGEPGETYDIQFHLIEPDGSLSWFVWRGRWERDEHGAARLPGAMVDVTELKQTEQALRLSEERFRLAAKAISGFVYEWDLETSEVFRSEGLETLLGVSAGEAGHEREWWIGRVHPEDSERVQREMDRVLAGESGAFELEYRALHADGRWVGVFESGYVVRDEHGAAKRVIGCRMPLAQRRDGEPSR